MLPFDELGISLMPLQLKLVVFKLSAFGSGHMIISLLAALDANNVAAAADPASGVHSTLKTRECIRRTD